MKRLLLIALCGLFTGATGAQAMPSSTTAASPTRQERDGVKRIRVAGDVANSSLIYGAKPEYPPQAKQARISGIVRLHVIISTNGVVLQSEVVSGHPLLVQSAIDSVRNRRYRPTFLNGEPVEVDTTVDVYFTLPKPPTDTPSPVKRIKMSPPIVNTNLIEQPHPIYPAEANAKKVQGHVKLGVVVAQDGSVEQVRVVPGNPLLTRAAMEAVRAWKYKPILLNGQAVEVETTVDVIFKIDDKKPDDPK